MDLKTLDSRIISRPAPQDIGTHPDFVIRARPICPSKQKWTEVTPYRISGSWMNLTEAALQHTELCLASLEFDGEIEIMVQWTAGTISEAEILPSIHGIEVTVLEQKTATFTMTSSQDVMLMLNGNKWTAVHIVANEIDHSNPTCNTKDIWYFGPGINNCKAMEHVVDGKLRVPSGKTVYLANGAFLTVGLHFKDVDSAGVCGPGFIYLPQPSDFIMEKQGAILIENSTNISVSNVTAVTAKGFSFLAGQSKGIDINRYRSFSSAGNGDGLHFLSTSSVTIKKCFLRNSDDTIAINCDRWNYKGSSEDYIIEDCVLLADIAHPILIGTHGNPKQPSAVRNVRISNIDILDHEENQAWYQGCIALNAGDGNLLENIYFKDIRVRKITKGQLVNIRVMQNAMWTTGPGRAVRNVIFENLSLASKDSSGLNPSQILGYDRDRCIEGITFRNLVVAGHSVHEGMKKPRWYMVEDFVPVFVNEHVKKLVFLQ